MKSSQTDTQKDNDAKQKNRVPEDTETPASEPMGDVCEKAPEWAEHYRLYDPDDPCDDGRRGDV
ncbi:MULTISPECIES: hypothetical protein [Desulfococcus]|jgi:hypothetical protein|uniref:Uncharacterized protein n=1 Tax=Desulfococcus multivorans DSM 2059 TaxID=1121405 RepID=S7TDA7_DESML|nr:hypothetical protein [Desulfococcus multivorans]AOY58789.1 uncharacterized protein Dmul_20170 [Desulfococcus multivorans]AQV01073.1 hypothetical protein B2D07_10015 [Desulfococcus multivorans]EPR35167.1 hypothetical protein dsmv_3159 [Desulfococcus multivorans DSM 2059]MDX9819829.1 hypothetical protein [Desulfococcus multivorans]SJZ50301.1 hypothetical protein SAMN02745446_00713 [Desulfococcus multivorans DSM 2059]